MYGDENDPLDLQSSESEEAPLDAPIPAPWLRKDDCGLTDNEKHSIALRLQRENDKILALNDRIAREIRRMRSTNGTVKARVRADRMRAKMLMEERVRKELAQQEMRHKQRELQRRDPPRILSDVNALLNHYCLSRGMGVPRDEYRSVPLKHPISRPGKTPRTHDYACTLVVQRAGSEEEFEGEPAPTKKAAKAACSKRLLLAQFPECDSFEQVAEKLGREHEEKRKRRLAAVGTGGWKGGKGGWKGGKWW
eukprot:TRINITY_DN23949_c0_g1_i1.p1 TRINITY_DN23949_c0_g1~~TRINITY_DN23949_c0_g1_i1.p1  ORF type:complete len:283 (+),score=128.04 TRINITY_DN23949_c0_g1_i1:98-850(+)